MLMLLAMGICVATSWPPVQGQATQEDDLQAEARFFDIKKKLCELGLAEVRIFSQESKGIIQWPIN